ncbi:MAG: hypothetical protein L6R30_19245, partial [Thermoanaerobaculia bacterium]|nr:hypothetical protein [Thermoanaerobaculia bacterium]
ARGRHRSGAGPGGGRPGSIGGHAGPAGSGPFITYGVVNDGRDVDSGTSDGTYLEMTGLGGTPAK